MNCFEFEGKRILSGFGIPTPRGELVTDLAAPAPLKPPFVLKAQALTGGRGKAGGVRICRTGEEYRRNAAEILALSVKGHPVNGLLCEERVSARRELYLSITLQGVSKPTLILSRSGGMEIEEVAKNDPDQILKMEIDPFLGLKAYQLRAAAKAMAPEDTEDFLSLVQKVQQAFFETRALLIEINPLGVVNGKLMAMDAKVILDDHAQETRGTLESIEAARGALPNWRPREKEPTTITHVPFDGGDIGLISDGAGTGMLTLDLITDAGGKVASFCELGGVTPAEVMYRAMQLTLRGRERQLKAVMVVLIGGFNRMDDMANGITGYLRDHPTGIPVFTRMCGTMEEEGKRIMAEAGLPDYDNLTETVRELVRTAGEVG